jgi:hypothetical protein
LSPADGVQSYDWVPVESSHVAAVGFEAYSVSITSKSTSAVEVIGRLYVAYKNGDVYGFPRVTRHTYETIYSAQSVGRALNLLFPQHTTPREKLGHIDPERLKC